MAPHTLVIGGTGPTGPHVVNGLRARGHDVTILHTGRHEVDEIGPEVAHIHTDPFDAEVTGAALGDATFDGAIVMYGRLRTLAPLLAGRVGSLVTIGGVAAVHGWVEPTDLVPAGLTVPGHPDGPLAPADEPIGKVRRIVETEQVVLDHHPGAVHLRYPMLYGPRQLIPREWPLVKRALDGRRPLIVADGGLTLKAAAYVENAAHSVLCAVDAIDRHGADQVGGIYNVTDTRTLTLAQIAELIGDELGHRFELVSLPPRLAVSARPLLMHPSSAHRVVNSASLREVLGYDDVVEPEEGVRRTARWLADNPPSPAAQRRLEDPFDYAAEDALIERWERLSAELAAFADAEFSETPGYGPAYYGREPNPATGTSRVEPVSP